MQAGRSRTPDRIERVQTRYQKVRTENCGGKNFRRRLKSVCLLVRIDTSRWRFSHSEACARRQRQAEDAHWWVKEGGWLPRKGEKILERGESDLDSELAESVHCHPNLRKIPDQGHPRLRSQRTSRGRTIFVSEGNIIKPTASSRPSIIISWFFFICPSCV